jgi:hypothetical protein
VVEPEQRVGVLFVHGIGSQPQSETLRHFAGPLIDWLALWHAERGLADPTTGFHVLESHLVFDQSVERPSWVALQLPAFAGNGSSHPASTWVLAEAWWASSLLAPGFFEMWRYSAHVLRRAVGRLFFQALRDAIPRPLIARAAEVQDPAGLWYANERNVGRLARAVEILSAFVLALGYLIAGILGYVVLVPLFVLAQVPIKAVREFILVKIFRTFLLEGFGDFKTYARDPVQAMNARGRVESAIEWLAKAAKCDHILVVAHSQGAVVAFDALSGGNVNRESIERVRKFVTLGGALNKAWLLEPTCVRIRRTLPPDIYWLDAWSPYDPVPGERLVRVPVGLPIVAPSKQVSERMHWYESSVYSEKRDLAPDAPPTGPQPRQLVNFMNVLREHDGYWRNGEQFVSRIAQEIDVAAGWYRDSRFSFSDYEQRARRRVQRVTTLAGWRLAAMLAFVVAVIWRVSSFGWERLIQDGRAVVFAAETVYIDDLIGLPAGIVGGLFSLIGTVLSPARSVGPIAAASDALAQLFATVPWENVGLATLAILAYGAVYLLIYWLTTKVAYDGWDERERNEAVRIVLPRRSPHQIPLRTGAVFLALGLAAFILARFEV